MYPVAFEVTFYSGETPTYITLSQNDLIKSIPDYFSLSASYSIYRVDTEEQTKLDPLLRARDYALSGIVRVSLVHIDEDFPIHRTPALPVFRKEETVEINHEGSWLPYKILETSQFAYTAGSLWNEERLEIRKEEHDKIRKPLKKLLNSESQIRAKGIYNIGNTCYMNSVLQSLNYTPLFSEFFTSLGYVKYIANSSVSLTKRIFPRELSTIFQTLNDSTKDSCMPLSFHKEILSHCPTIEKSSFRDCYEFFRVLIDSLHRDLHRSSLDWACSTRLYSLDVSAEECISQEFWESLQGIGGSVISDYFTSQIRKAFFCEQCGKGESYFERCFSLTLPIPVEQERVALLFKFIPRDNTKLKKFVFNLDKHTKIDQILKKVGKTTGVSENNLVFAHVKDKIVKRIFYEAKDIKSILNYRKSKLYLYEIIRDIQDGEKDGMPTLFVLEDDNWRENLIEGKTIDFYYKSSWYVSRIYTRINREIAIFIYTSKGKWLNICIESTQIAPFRTHTTNNNKILGIPIIMTTRTEGNFTTFGTPLLFSIGNWYNWKDLHDKLAILCSTYSTDISPDELKQYLFFYMFDQHSICALCKLDDCLGCPLPNTYESLVWLNDKSDIFICVEWQFIACYYKHLPGLIEEIRSFDLFECLEEYLSEHTVQTGYAYCSHTTSKRNFQIYRLPDILVFHLNRFRGSTKLENLVEFPLDSLDLSEWVVTQNPNVTYEYELFSIVNHLGLPSDGHYTAYCLYSRDNGPIWLEFDDTRVSIVQDSNSLVTSNAYILFYRRKKLTTKNIINMSW